MEPRGCPHRTKCHFFCLGISLFAFSQTATWITYWCPHGVLLLYKNRSQSHWTGTFNYLGGCALSKIRQSACFGNLLFEGFKGFRLFRPKFQWCLFLGQSSQRFRQHCKVGYEPATVVGSSNVGIGYRLQTIACFAYVMSMHRRIYELLFGTITTGFTKCVGPSTGSIIPRSRISVVLSWTFSLRLKGILPGVSQWGLYPGIFVCISTSRHLLIRLGIVASICSL